MATLFHRTLVTAVAAAAAAAVGAADAASARGEDRPTSATGGRACLVVAPRDLHAALSAWRAHRQSQGIAVTVREPGADVAATVREAHAASGGALRFVLLLGDVDRVPCAYRPVVATAKWERDTRIATDAPYADVDGDGVPDLAIGRVPASSADEAQRLLARAVAAESAPQPGEWRRKLHVVAGTGGFGPLQDAALEQMTKQFLTKEVPPEYVVTGTYGNPLSAWCPPPAEFADVVLGRFAEGSLVLAYIGHGSPGELDKVRVGREKHPILGPAEVQRLATPATPPVVVLVACSAGMFDGDADSLAESMLRRPSGPVAIVASSRVSTPYSNGILSREMLTALFADRVATAGELLLSMKRRLVAPADGDEQRASIEKLAAAFYDADAARRTADRREHLSLYNLLGDPCARIARPDPLAVAAAGSVVAGTPLEVSGTLPSAGTLRVEIARRRDAPTPLGSRKTADEWRATYRAANTLEIATVEEQRPAGAFRVSLAVPADAKPGPCYVRVWFQGAKGSAAGGRYLDVAAAPAPASPVPAAPEPPR